MGTILLLSGPNLNLFGQREPSVYGTDTLDDMVADARAVASAHGHELEHLQSNHEGELVDAVQGARGRCVAIVVNAGHEPFFLCRADGCIEDIPPTGMVLGLMETRYVERRVSFEPGDMLFACSDGITAAAAGPSLGVPRVKELVRENRAQSAALLGQRVLDSALNVYGAPKDDMSLIVLKRTE